MDTLGTNVQEIERKAREKIVKPWGAVGGRSTKCFDENPYANMSGFISRPPPRRKLPEGQRPFTPSGPGKKVRPQASFSPALIVIWARG